jgi:hypothetical protein
MMVVALFLIRKRVLKPGKVNSGPTWGCGYTAGNSRQQYTGTSYAANFAELAAPVLNQKVEYREIHEEDIFPSRRTFNYRSGDGFTSLLNKFTAFGMLGLKKIARLQTGNIQHYILYAFIFILIIFVLLYLNVL